MTTANSQFFAILTAVGEAKQANANALGVPWTISAMGVGDANGTDPIPSRAQTQLINERRRASLNQLKVDPNNASVIIAEQVIPPDEGGWWIREIGLYDEAGNLVAVANCAPSFKPLLSQGTGKTQVVRLNIIVTSTANVQLKIDPAVVLATREYVDSRILEVLPANRQTGSYTKVTINARGVVVNGENPNTLAGYGIGDAFTQDQVTTLLNGKAGKATTLAGYGIGDAFTQDQVTTLLNGKAGKSTTLAGYGISDAFTQDQVTTLLNGKAGKSTTLAGYGISDAFTQDQVTTLLNGKAGKSTTLAGYGIGDAFTQDQVTTLLNGKAGKSTTLSGYGITDAPTKDDLTTGLAGKASKATTLAGYGIGDAFTQDEVMARMLGVRQTIQDMTASRALNTAYTNTTGKPIIVHVSAIQPTAGGSGTFRATVDGQMLTGTTAYGGGGYFLYEFIVGPGETYSVAFFGTAYNSLVWKERR